MIKEENSGYVGKMQFYLAALDDLVKEENENPSIGIIICKSKDRTVVEYTLHDSQADNLVGRPTEDRAGESSSRNVSEA